MNVRLCINGGLLALVLASAMGVVKTQYLSRQTYVAHEQAQMQGNLLAAENERLRLVIREQGRPERIERIARRELGMELVNPAVTVYAAPSTSAKGAP